MAAGRTYVGLFEQVAYTSDGRAGAGGIRVDVTTAVTRVG